MYLRYPPGLFCGLLISATVLASQASPEGYSLRYRFAPGQVFVFETEQSSTFNGTFQGQTLKTTNQLRMVKRWRIQEADSGQNARIEVTNLETRMTVSEGANSIELDSRDPEKQPEQFRELLAVIGKPLGVVTVSPLGAVIEIKRLVDAQDLSAGLANLCLPLPEQPVSVGDQWQRRYSLTVTRSDGSTKMFDVLQKYTLEKVEEPIATVEYKTVLLAPIDDPQLELQLAQQQPAGSYEFDLQRGLVVAHRQQIKKTVVGFAGPGTAMELAVRFHERLRPLAPSANAKP